MSARPSFQVRSSRSSSSRSSSRTKRAAGACRVVGALRAGRRRRARRWRARFGEHARRLSRARGERGANAPSATSHRSVRAAARAACGPRTCAPSKLPAWSRRSRRPPASSSDPGSRRVPVDSSAAHPQHNFAWYPLASATQFSKKPPSGPRSAEDEVERLRQRRAAASPSPLTCRPVQVRAREPCRRASSRSSRREFPRVGRRRSARSHRQPAGREDATRMAMARILQRHLMLVAGERRLHSRHGAQRHPASLPSGRRTRSAASRSRRRGARRRAAAAVTASVARRRTAAARARRLGVELLALGSCARRRRRRAPGAARRPWRGSGGQ